MDVLEIIGVICIAYTAVILTIMVWLTGAKFVQAPERKYCQTCNGFGFHMDAANRTVVECAKCSGTGTKRSPDLATVISDDSQEG